MDNDSDPPNNLPPPPTIPRVSLQIARASLPVPPPRSSVQVPIHVLPRASVQVPPMRTSLPMPPPRAVAPESPYISESADGEVDVVLKRDDDNQHRHSRIHTHITVAENATRAWLTAEVMLACILLALLAVDIRSSRNSLILFPASFNTTCIDSSYAIKAGIQGAIQTTIDDAINITNTQYQYSVKTARNVIHRTMNLSSEVLLNALKQINPMIYCTIDSGFTITRSVRKVLRSLDFDTGLSLDCGVAQSICDDVQSALNDVKFNVSQLVGGWPSIPSSLTDTLDGYLAQTGFKQLVGNLAKFDAPQTVVSVNTTELAIQAMSSATAFDDIAVTCADVAVKFESATSKIAEVMYYVEIALWVVIVVLWLGTFIYGIIRQFPGVIYDRVNGKLTDMRTRWEKRLRAVEQDDPKTWQLFMVWVLNYVCFKKGILTTIYGILGIILVYNLAAFTNTAQRPVEIWIDESLGPGFDKMQGSIQEGINQAISGVQDGLNLLAQKTIVDSLSPLNNSLNDIKAKKQEMLGRVYDTLDTIDKIDVVGPFINNGIQCLLPTTLLNIVNTAVDMVLSFAQDIMMVRVYLPQFSFPNLSVYATRTTHVAIMYTVQQIQDSLYTYRIVFIILSIAFGILVLQASIFVAIRLAIMRIRKR